MKNILKKAAVAVLSIGLSAPLLPAQNPYGGYRGGDHYSTASWRDGGRDRDHRGGDRNRDYRRDEYRDRGSYGYARESYYDRGRYDDRDRHAGRSVAIIGGSAAAGALFGAAAGDGKGAAIGAIVGGIGGLIADQAVRSHDHRRR